MDSRPIRDQDTDDVTTSGGNAEQVWPATTGTHASKSSEVRFPGDDGGKSLAEMAQRDLSATLQLLAERAQYITGATGAAIALRDQDEMVCRASAGPSAPEVGTQLQVNSGLSGESVRTRQTLRCDDAFSDPRVNRESCEALGIRSVVVMPLLRGDEVIGVFELFSDQANVFETRDLVALERMGTMVHTALEHSTAALGLPPMLGEAIQPLRASDSAGSVAFEQPEPARPTVISGGSPAPARQVPAASGPSVVFHGKAATAANSVAPMPVTVSPVARRLSPVPAIPHSPVEIAEDDILEEASPIPAPPARTVVRPTRAAASFEELLARADQDPILSDVAAAHAAIQKPATAASSGSQSAGTAVESETESRSVQAPRTAVANLKRCQECGFPVSEGRQLCLDCEKKKAAAGAVVNLPTVTAPTPDPLPPLEPENVSGTAPTFMHSDTADGSWLSTHKFMVIALVLAAIGIVAVVVLR